MTDADHFYMPRNEQSTLCDKLSQIPSLAEDLAITLTRQSAITKRGLGSPRRPKRMESRLPFHIGAADVEWELHNTLATWVRATCESRGIDYTGTDSLISLSAWLTRNIVALAMTEGSKDAYTDIWDAIDRCRRMVDLPPDDEVVIDRARIEKANRQILTAGQIEKIAPKLGDLGKGLNKRRVETLNYNKALWPCVSLIKGDPKFYRLGDVLDAHHRHARKPRKVAS